ncbi:MAG TPA: hypothetical protein VEJ36_03675 [Nitrososphaerales archaeon]|nr:hypothetical protein [Nitrososphaerales archaeon]
MMKRITITLEEDMYLKLLEYSLERSKAKLRNYSMSEAIRELLSEELSKIEHSKPRNPEDWVHSPFSEGGSKSRTP